jgi:transketolase
VHDRKALDELCINTIRFLAVDGVERAHSGHPGAPLGAAAIAYVLWDRFLKHNPRDPHWPDRDRFVLSAGHASMLLYALLHLTGYGVSLDDLRQFRQWGSITPGHPERGDTPGVETTTGPLGQGFANGVGMAMAERSLAARFNRPGHDIIDHRTYVLCSDGDLMEGVSAEAASLAGTLGLGRLICLYDDNDISIEGHTDLTFTEDVGGRFRAYGWHVIGPIDGFDAEAIAGAVEEAVSEAGRPSLLICRTRIGYGSPGENTPDVHGSPLGEDDVRKTKQKLGWPLEPTFHVPEDARRHLREAVSRGEADEQRWRERLGDYEEEQGELAAELDARLSGCLPDAWDRGLDDLFPADAGAMATRSASGRVLNELARRVPALLGGSADLAPSNKTLIDGGGDFSSDNRAGRNIRFGVREHAMGSIANGIAAHGGFVPYTGTFLTFSDYMRPPMRLAAMMGLRVVYVFTHDSIGLGEDGPTHQPVEHVMGLRTVPNLTVIRPADASETTSAWRAALMNADGPTAIVLARQSVPLLNRAECAPAGCGVRGGYVLWESDAGQPEIILIGTGSETHIALEAGEKLASLGRRVRVVSLPSWELFERQSDGYRDSVLPAAVTARVAVEAGLRLGWERYVGLGGGVVGMDGFGASAPMGILYERFGITVDAVVVRAEEVIARVGVRPERRQ